MKINEATFQSVTLQDGELSDNDYKMVFQPVVEMEDWGDLGPVTEMEDWGEING